MAGKHNQAHTGPSPSTDYSSKEFSLVGLEARRLGELDQVGQKACTVSTSGMTGQTQLDTDERHECLPAVEHFWVAVKELKSSYYIGETLLFTIYTNYGNLI